MPKAAKNTTTIQNAADPILKLIAAADRRLDAFHKASETERGIRGKIGEHNCAPAVVETPFRFGDLHRGLGFASIELIEGQSKLATERASSVIKNARRQLKTPGISADWRLQLRENISREQRRFDLIKDAKAALVGELRREQARIAKLWKRTGYDKARTRRKVKLLDARMAVRALSEVQPSTAVGSIRLLKFVADQARLF